MNDKAFEEPQKAVERHWMKKRLNTPSSGLTQ